MWNLSETGGQTSMKKRSAVVGSWDLIVKRTRLFAAALCGSGMQDWIPNRKAYSKEEYERLRGMPIWVFQGAKDKTVPAAA